MRKIGALFVLVFVAFMLQCGPSSHPAAQTVGPAGTISIFTPTLASINGQYLLVVTGSGFTSITNPPGGGNFEVHNSPTTITMEFTADGGGNIHPGPGSPPGAVINFLISGNQCEFDLLSGSYTIKADGTGTINMSTRLDSTIMANQSTACQIAAV